jgi:NAD(P)-dependent dehydrogenase (short-subunit alcohol dehydrogenase family)
LAFVDGDIGQSAVASKIVATAVQKFGSIDALIYSAGIFFTKPFTDYTAEDFKALSSTNLEGFLYVTQGAVKQMLAQKSGGSVVTITGGWPILPQLRDVSLRFSGCRTLAAGEGAGLDAASLQLSHRTPTAVRDPGVRPRKTLSPSAEKTCTKPVRRNPYSFHPISSS